MWYDPNGQANQSRDDALRLADMVRVACPALCATTASRPLRRHAQQRADRLLRPAGGLRGASRRETINYIEAHDNQTLFDINAFRLPQSTSLADRVRVQNLGAAIVLLAQGVPFVHAGQEILRSKSLDRDSYNAGDWFNRLDYSYASNNFGVGLPMAGTNQDNWGIMAPILTNPLIKPDTRAILSAKAAFEDLLAIRKDTTLFRLRSAQDVIDRLKFHNVGPSQEPGVIVMEIDGNDPGKYVGAQYKGVVVVFNVDKVAKTLAVPALKGRKLQLHRIQRNGSDEVVKASDFDRNGGVFSIPARTTAVFVQNAND